MSVIILARRQFVPMLTIGLAGCSLVPGTPAGATPLDMAKLYATDLTDALSAAGEAFLAGPPKPSDATAILVTNVLRDMRAAAQLLSNMQATPDARSTVLQIVVMAQQLSPILSPLLGPVALYIPLALGVLQAFVQSLPPPLSAPANPPAQLHGAALRYRLMHAPR